MSDSRSNEGTEKVGTLHQFTSLVNIFDFFKNHAQKITYLVNYFQYDLEFLSQKFETYLKQRKKTNN